MKTALLALAALGLAALLAAPVATAACPPEGQDYEFPDGCADSPILVNLDRCAGFVLGYAHDMQIFVGETIACL